MENSIYQIVAICTPMASNPDWEAHQARLMAFARKQYPHALILCALENKRTGRYQGNSGREMGLADVKRASVCIFGAGWNHAEGCADEIYAALHGGACRQIYFERIDQPGHSIVIRWRPVGEEFYTFV